MAENTTDSSRIAYLTWVTRELNRYIPLPALIFGTIGNLLNLIVFTRPSLRANTCSLYFISGSVANFLSLYIGLITPFLGLYNYDPTQRSNLLCKTRFYLRFITITLSTWFVLFACIDRFLSSSASARYRAWSTPRLAKRVIILASIVCFIFPYTHAFYCYSTYPRNVCAPVSNLCKLTTDGTLLLFNSGVPPLVMVFMSLLTLRNMKQLHPNHLHRRGNVSVVRILLIQVAILVIFATPITAQKIYSCVIMFSNKSPLTAATDALINQISTEISNVNNSTTFYAYSLTSKKFRKEVSKIFTLLCRKRAFGTNIVQPRPISVKFKSSLNVAMFRMNHAHCPAEVQTKYRSSDLK